MDSFIKAIQVRWSDLDPNVHLRHSVYYDWGAMNRIEFFYAVGLTAGMMQQLRFGPILFREECIFKKEIRLGDNVSINLALAKSRKDYSRWSIRHEIMKNGDTVCAILTVDGAWIDIEKRKLTVPPGLVLEVFSKMPRTDDFEWVE
jgi:acyl-CoA thioester hydrolase